LGGAVAEIMAEANFNPARRFKRIGIPDMFPDEYGSQASLMAHWGNTSETIISVIQQFRSAGPTVSTKAVKKIRR
jgi:transketolase